MENLHSKISQPHIYKITNLVNGKIYVGKHIGNNLKYICGGKSVTLAIQKHGFENFKKEIIVSGNFNETLLDELEKHYIWIFNSSLKGIGYNMTLGGGGAIGYKHTEESREKMSISSKGRIVSEETKRKLSLANKGKSCKNNIGKIRSEEHKRKISEANKGRKLTDSHKNALLELNFNRVFSEETRRKISESNKGRRGWNNGLKMSKEFCEKISNSKKGVLSKTKGINIHSEEQKKLWSQKRKGIPVSEEMKERISNTLKDRVPWNKGITYFKSKSKNPSPSRKEIIVTDLDGIFVKRGTIDELRIKGCSHSGKIRACCKGEISSFNGYIFKWGNK